MKKTPPKVAGKKTAEPAPFDKHAVNFSKFKPDIKEKDLKKLFLPPINEVIFPFAPIDTLSCTKTVGRGRTNVTIINSTIVQTDALNPFAAFDLSVTKPHNPAISIHFDPAAYGIAYNATYFIEFMIEAFGQSTFDLEGFPLAGNLLNTGTKILNGPSKVTLIIQNMPPTVTYAYLEETNGRAWNWYSTRIRFPPLVIKP